MLQNIPVGNFNSSISYAISGNCKNHHDAGMWWDHSNNNNKFEVFKAIFPSSIFNFFHDASYELLLSLSIESAIVQ